MRVDVLGPVAVEHEGQVLAGAALGGRRARVALAALALTEGSVPSERLAALIWGDSPPLTWQPALRGVIRSLRTVLANLGLGGQHCIVTTPAGYRLAPEAGVDIREARRQLHQAHDAWAAGRASAALRGAEAAAVLDGAQLLPGEDLPWLDGHRDAVHEIHQQALRLIVDVAAALGDTVRSVAAAREAVVGAPLGELEWRLLIGALDRAGERAGAVEAFEQCRSALSEELGVDPSRETIAVYLQVLRDQPASRWGALPPPAAPFHGRDRELAAVAQALGRPGLLTLTGGGGVGKSRLALEAVRRLPATAVDRRWLSLAAVTRDELVAPTVALALGVPSVGGEIVDAAAPIAELLAPMGPLILVLDGCEAVLDGAASLVAELISSAPALTVVATSRAALSVDGERELRLEPLPLPALSGPQEIGRLTAVSLLTARVREGGGELIVDSTTAPLLLALCRACGGVPLALELAAAQLTAVSLPDVLDQLALDSPDHERLRGMLRRSYELLDPDEAEVFRTFAVLDGAVSLPLLRSVVGRGRIEPLRVVRILRELTARGLVWVDRTTPRWRYRQDDDVRRFARAQLVEGGEDADAFSRLAQALCALLPEDARASPAPYLDDISDLLPSVRSLLGACADGEAPIDLGLEVAFRLHRYWAATSVPEGRFWLSRLLVGEPSSPWLGYATFALGYLSYWSGDVASATRDLRRAAELLRESSPTYAAHALLYLGGLLDDLDEGTEALGAVAAAVEVAAATEAVDLWVATRLGLGCVLGERADASAVPYAVEAAALCRESGSSAQLAAVLATAAMVCWQVGALEECRRLVTDAAPLHRDDKRIARVVWLSVSAGLALADGDHVHALASASQADLEGTELGVERELPLARCLRALAARAVGDRTAALAAARSALAAAAALSYPFPTALCLETAVEVVEPVGTDSRAALVLASAESVRRRGARPPAPTLRPAFERLRERCGPALGPPLSREAATALAMVLLDQVGAAV